MNERVPTVFTALRNGVVDNLMVKGFKIHRKRNIPVRHEWL
jgi:hypothetical protein